MDATCRDIEIYNYTGLRIGHLYATAQISQCSIEYNFYEVRAQTPYLIDPTTIYNTLIVQYCWRVSAFG